MSSATVANDGVVAINGAVVNGDAQQDQQLQQQPQQQQQQRLNGWGMFKGFIIRMLIIYFVSSLFRGSSPPAPTVIDPNKPMPPAFGPGTNLFPKGAALDLYVFLSETEVFTEFDQPDLLFWRLPGLNYGDWEAGMNRDGYFEWEGTINASEGLMNNGSLYIHVYLVRSGSSPNPKDHKYSKKYTIYNSRMLTKYKRRRLSRTVNLLTGESEGGKQLLGDELPPPNVTHLPPATHWHPNLTLQLLDDHSPWVQGSIPPPLNDYIHFFERSNEYYPVLYFNDYWNLHQDYVPVNETTPQLTLRITFGPISLFRWQLYAAQTMRNKWYSSFLGEGVMQESDEEQDTLKKTLVDTNPYLLGLTIIVSLVHSVFEILAFKNDIQFWRSRESLEGLSVRSVFFSVFQSLIVVLYVLDNDTNFVVRVSVFIGLGIEVWKIKKVVNIKVDRANPWFGLIPRVSIQHKSSYTESDTKKFDQMAFRYLSWLLYPMLVIYAVYSLLYQEHRGWYSWVLSMLYGFLLTFGFIMMTPQLFINYKMKSVAHLPWRMLTYKALNTFIDDIFAFVIKMPTLYRLGCLRDDVIFFIYLYQRWIYPIDPKRMNEFGTSQEMIDEHQRQREQGSSGPQAIAAGEAETTQTESKKDQ